MKNKSILITRDAGNSACHVVRQLGASKEPVIMLDKLFAGFEAAVTAVLHFQDENSTPTVD